MSNTGKGRNVSLKVFALPLALVVLLASADVILAEGPPPICFWSDQGPMAVQVKVSHAAVVMEPEDLLAILFAGPSEDLLAQGVWSAIPGGTALERLDSDPAGGLVVYLTMAPEALIDLDHERFELIVEQIGWTLDSLVWTDLQIFVRDPNTGDGVPLASFLPPVTSPRKPTDPIEPEGGAAYVGQPPAPGQGQPLGALSGRTVYVSAGHGWQWGDYGWRTQRPVYQSFIEDLNNGEAVNQYLLQYLWNAGAMVWPARERDLNSGEYIVDNDGDVGFVTAGSWISGSNSGYDLDAGGTYSQTGAVTGTATATATWSTTITVDGEYAVYVWYRSASANVPDARYTISHAGGATEVSVDQRYHGFTWHYIGTYGFQAGDVATVTLTNQSASAGATVVADAIRIGGGTFDSLTGIGTTASYPPNKPWWEIAAFYYTQRMGMSQPDNDVVSRPVYARWEHAGTSDDAVYVSWHTNGWDGNVRGTETYAHSGEWLPRTEGSLELRDAIHAELVHDIRAGWDPLWTDRGTKTRNLGELRLLWDEDVATRMPGALIEIAFHDNPDDADALREPTFQMLAARAIYQGIVAYFEQRDATDLTLLPEPPTHVAVRNVPGGRALVSWQPPPTDTVGLLGDAATGYRVYTSTNGIGWSDGVSVASGTAFTITGLVTDQLLFVRVAAVNEGGESFPSETLGLRAIEPGQEAGVLIVNGFDRLNQTMLVPDYDPVEGYNLRMSLGLMNSYDYLIQHGEAITRSFDSASNEAVEDGSVPLDGYGMVDWIVGEESTQDETLSSAEQALLSSFLDGGGGLFISGSEIGWDLDQYGSSYDRAFYNDVLRADYWSDDAETYEVIPSAGGIFDGLASFRFDAAGLYAAEYPDRLLTYGGSSAALAYVGGLGGTAAVQYSAGVGSCPRVVYFGFPFETIDSDRRGDVMGRVLGFMAPCLPQYPSTRIDVPAHLSAHRTTPSFAGTASATGDTIQSVQVQVQRPDSLYWDGASWGAPSVWLTATGDTDWQYALPTLSTEGEYLLRARAWTTGGISDTSPAEAIFIYDTLPPAGTTLITPTGGITLTAVTVDLVWNEVPADGGSALAYAVDLDGNVLSTTQTLLASGYVVEGEHEWGVRVFDAAGNVSGWVTDTFRVVYHRMMLPLTVRGFDGGVQVCSDPVVNGGFESGDGWTLNNLAIYATAQVHAGARSARVGIVSGTNQSSWSSVMQAIELPAGGSATLDLWVYPIGDDAGDYHYVGFYDQVGTYHSLGSWLSDTQTWEERSYDLSSYLGQTISLYVGTRNDGDGGTAAMYIDQVTLEVCP